MKKIILFLVAMSAIVVASGARQPEIGPSYAWKVLPPLGLREEATIDTLPYNFYLQGIPSAISPAWACTGNLGAEGINMIWSERPQMNDFFFRDALAHWIPNLGTMRFYNTRIPMTLVDYTSSGGRENAQDRLKATFSGNINAKAQVGALADYIYSKGSYNNQATKDLIWGFSGSYIGDRYEFQGFLNHFNLLNKENGGITDPLYITDPALVQGGVTSVDTKTIPTKLSHAHTRYVGTELYLNNRYKIGFWDEEYSEEDPDSVVSRTYIPVTSVIWTLSYNAGKHLFKDTDPSETAKYFENTYLSPNGTYDRTAYSSVENTVGLSMHEGFNKYAKFGLSGFVTYRINKYTQMPDTMPRGDDSNLSPFPEGFNGVETKATENLAWAGGQLTKQQGSVLTYSATAKFGILDRVVGDIDLRGDIETRIPLRFDTVAVAAFGHLSNQAAPYLLNNFISNHFVWKNNFGKERRVHFGGSVTVPRTGTFIEAEAANLQNYIYFGENFTPVQHGGSVQVFSARLRQNMHVGILHWDNSVTYQTTSDESVLPLPKLAVFSNLYLKFKIATLFVQLGVDCDYYTRYYAPNYQPATATFANQRTVKLGNYPFMNAYANFKLSKTRFFVLFSHVNQGMFSKDYFSLPNYPLNPRRFQIGLSVDFAN